ncbi:hypothetical protein D9K79_07265 [Acinetobacter cumulans]|uniref:Uncharacterized protein n=1 Tax=Acinetobacter cumulans TaxID=2136182 RepID=A0A498CX55_9GAMM|nr:hypothetical protein [Acinetobacter cumulans]QCO20327.1 hypothetical protein C9E88_001710 [Acinetobacter cumulans]RKG51293.1 hypothetical protein D7V68_01305 [Acinetobacter cumulans]RLL35120.1 hypothetical protein D9K80_09790 [Acinetobacter cumulans]RLL47227.1 hypothetical protein D9K79_07265 [Acinetobacter cumulans]
MQTLISNISKRIRQVYQRAEGFIEDEREFPLSQVFLNATFQRFVTDNVKMLQDLHADLHDDWLRLYATLNYNGLEITLTVDLKLVQMELNKTTQLIVFEQISDTKVLDAKYPNIFYKLGVKFALFFYQKVLNDDPLGMILEKLNVIKVKDDLLHLDLNRWLGKSRSIIDTLSKVHVNHAMLREAELVVIGNVNIAALFSKMAAERIEDWDEAPESDSEVTPIQQKSK